MMPSFELLLDPLFREPFVVGLLYAVSLPVLGAYLRLRDESMLPLAVAQLTSTGGLFSATVGITNYFGSTIAAAFAVWAKRALALHGSAVWGTAFVAAWAMGQLIAANTHLPPELFEQLIDGQLLLAGRAQVWATFAVVPISIATVARCSSTLLLTRLQPGNALALRGKNVFPQLAFDAAVALCLACAALSIGVMASFAAALLPAWAAFQSSGSWRAALAQATLIGLAAYLLAFATALSFDQPFGPVFVASLTLCSALACAIARR